MPRGERRARCASACEATLLTPGDQGFEEATRLWNGLIDKTPALVVQPTGVADVVEAVWLRPRARASLLSVRGGGHNIAGTALADGGLTIDMAALRGVVGGSGRPHGHRPARLPARGRRP